MDKQQKLTAIIFGSSGLTGRFLTELLLRDNRYEKLVLFVRREQKVNHGKIRQIIFNPEKINEIIQEIKGDQLFCCLGTTIKKAGSKESFLSTDYDLILDIARISIENKISVFTLISSIGASKDSRNFYLNTKGKTEDALKRMGFESLNILRPSMLLGLRPEHRPMEEAGKMIFKAFRFIMIGRFRKYRPIHAEVVARTMIKTANECKGISIFESDKIEEMGNV